MPGSVTSAFSEPEDFEAAFRAEGCHGLLITGRGRFRAQLTQVVLHVLRLSATEEQLSRIAFIAVPRDMVLIMFSKDSVPPLICGGISIREDEVMTLSPGQHVHARTGGSSQWGAIWLPAGELVRYGGALTGTPFAVPPAVQRWRPPRGALKHLHSLHAAAIRMVANRPQTLIDAEAAHGLEQQLIHGIVECLARGSTDTVTQSRRRHQAIMVHFERLLRDQADRAISITEMCATLGVSQRLLRGLCAQHLGMGPIGYDRLRRMSLVRRSLRRGDDLAPRVAEVARGYGFHSPGRFAVNYRAAFGESPSTTLRRRLLQPIVKPKDVLKATLV
jgi:AraC-like DNA-binding protein